MVGALNSVRQASQRRDEVGIRPAIEAEADLGRALLRRLRIEGVIVEAAAGAMAKRSRGSRRCRPAG